MGITQFKSTKELIAKSAEGYPLLGYAIYWSISDINVKHADFVQMLSNLGLPTDVAPAVQVKSAAIKAIKAHTKGRKNSFHKSVVDNEAKASFNILATTHIDEANDQLEVQTDTKVVLNKASKVLEVTGTQANEIMADFEAFKETYTSDRFRNVVLKLVKGHCQGMSIRERGGVYFVPSSHNEVFDKVQKLFDLFPSCSLEIVPVIDTAQAKKSMWKALVGEVTEELSKMKEDVLALEPDASESSLNVRLARFQKLKDKVENYEILLNGTAENLMADLNAISAEIKRRLL